MERFLLFDSGCSLCTELASAIERESDGWLKARSLREPEVQAMLDQARPGWQWEPMLLEVMGDQLHAFTGLAMRMRLIAGLGPRRAWHVAKLVHQAGMTISQIGLGRRQFLRRAGTLLAGIALLPIFRESFLRPPEGAPPPTPPHPLSELKMGKSVRLTASEAEALRQQALKSADISHIRAKVGFDANEVVVYRHEVVDGNKLWAVAFPASNGGVVLYHVLAHPVKWLQSEAFYYEVDGKLAYLRVASVNGHEIEVPSPNSVTPQVTCPGCPGPWLGRICSQCVVFDWGCLAEPCGFCLLACGGNLVCILACCGITALYCCKGWQTTCCTC